MEVLEEINRKIRQLFLCPDKDFHMDFCKTSRSYHLRNPKINRCHPLELFLIADRSMTGNKVGDLSKLLNKNVRWILGFYHGYGGTQSRYKSTQYLDGFATGENTRSKIEA